MASSLGEGQSFLHSSVYVTLGVATHNMYAPQKAQGSVSGRECVSVSANEWSTVHPTHPSATLQAVRTESSCSVGRADASDNNDDGYDPSGLLL